MRFRSRACDRTGRGICRTFHERAAPLVAARGRRYEGRHGPMRSHNMAPIVLKLAVGGFSRREIQVGQAAAAGPHAMPMRSADSLWSAASPPSSFRISSSASGRQTRRPSRGARGSAWDWPSPTISRNCTGWQHHGRECRRGSGQHIHGKAAAHSVRAHSGRGRPRRRRRMERLYALWNDRYKKRNLWHYVFVSLRTEVGQSRTQASHGGRFVRPRHARRKRWCSAGSGSP